MNDISDQDLTQRVREIARKTDELEMLTESLHQSLRRSDDLMQELRWKQEELANLLSDSWRQRSQPILPAPDVILSKPANYWTPGANPSQE